MHRNFIIRLNLGIAYHLFSSFALTANRKRKCRHLFSAYQSELTVRSFDQLLNLLGTKTGLPLSHLSCKRQVRGGAGEFLRMSTARFSKSAGTACGQTAKDVVCLLRDLGSSPARQSDCGSQTRKCSLLKPVFSVLYRKSTRFARGFGDVTRLLQTTTHTA